MAEETPVYKLRIRELRDFVEKLMDGDEPEKLFSGGWGAARGSIRPPAKMMVQHASIEFNRPIRRSNRLSTVDGRTSFHFSHSYVVRVRAATFINGSFLRPGAPREHCRYVEREGAVATIDANLPLPDAGLTPGEPSFPQAYYQETDDDIDPYAFHPGNFGADAFVDAAIHFANLRFTEPGSAEDRLRFLPGVDVADEGRQFDLVLHRNRGRRLARKASDSDGGVRGAVGRTGALAQTTVGLSRGRGARTITAQHQTYIEHDTAVATQPDGAVAIITNIAHSAEDRLQFWELVEQEESEPGPDRMSVDPERDPEFWLVVASHERCPKELVLALAASDASARDHFIIPSGREMRVFLAEVPGWISTRKEHKNESAIEYLKAGKGLASFHDGRGGRSQYRIIGELPSELTMNGRMRVLSGFTQRFEELGIPFNLAMHAPDFGNDERQWHFHLDYYDRPARLLTAADMAWAADRHFVPLGQGVGEYGFAAKFRKNGKVSRPFRDDKIEEARADDWILSLRNRLAFVTNRELKREGQHPRFDPRSYDKMGIKAEPGEHLGTKLNAGEGKGRVSDRGIENEKKQWAAIEHQLEDQRQSGVSAVTDLANSRLARVGACDLSPANEAVFAKDIEEVEILGWLILEFEYEAATARNLPRAHALALSISSG
jgi:hypothetical protein